jgi:hypothetical protein
VELENSSSTRLTSPAPGGKVIDIRNDRNEHGRTEMSNTDAIRKAADILRANADILARHGFTSVPAMIASTIRNARNYDYNPMGNSILDLARGIEGVMERLDCAAGVIVRGGRREIHVSIPIGADLTDSNVLLGIVFDLRTIAL